MSNIPEDILEKRKKEEELNEQAAYWLWRASMTHTDYKDGPTADRAVAEVNDFEDKAQRLRDEADAIDYGVCPRCGHVFGTEGLWALVHLDDCTV